jgi:hypothetical protein
MATKTAKPVIVRVPQISPATRRRGAAIARRAGSATLKAAYAEKHTLAAVASAAVLGLAKKQGIALPKIDALGTPGTYGAALWIAGRFAKSEVLSHMATGLLSVAAYQLGAGETLSGFDVVGSSADTEGGAL